MGKGDLIILKPFTQQDVENKTLVINMLTHEDTIIHSDIGKQIYENYSNSSLTSLDAEYAIHRLVLTKFGYDTSISSVDNYRSIFKYYFKSPIDYNKDVINSVTYMRENKCMFYTTKTLNIGDKIPNCKLYNLDGKSQVTLFDALGNNYNYAFIAAFSNS